MTWMPPPPLNRQKREKCIMNFYFYLLLNEVVVGGVKTDKEQRCKDIAVYMEIHVIQNRGK